MVQSDFNTNQYHLSVTNLVTHVFYQYQSMKKHA